MRTAGFICLFAVFAIGLTRAEEGDADPIKAAVDHIDRGKAALLAGNKSEALALLQKAIGLIQESMVEGLSGFLPKVSGGWKASEIKTASGSFGTGEKAVQWSHASRTYTREADGVKVNVDVSTSPQLISTQRMSIKMYQDPRMREMMSRDPNLKFDVIDEAGWAGVKLVRKGQEASVIAFHTQVMVSLSVSKDLEDVRDEFWSAIDRKGLASFMGGE